MFKNAKQRGAFFEKEKNPNGLVQMPTLGNSIQQANSQFALPSSPKPNKFGRIKKMFKGNKFV